MSMSRTGRLILSCGVSTIVVAIGAVVWIGMESKGRSAEEKRAEQGMVPAKLGPTGPETPLSFPGTEGVTPGPVAPSLTLEKGETYYGKGEVFFKNGDFSSASRYLEAEVHAHPDRFYPAYLLGISLWKEGKRDEAIASLTSAASLDPASVKARVNLGRVLNDAGRFEEALCSSDEAIAIDPQSSPAHNVRGRALLNLGRRDEAIESFKTSIEKDPTNAYAQNNLGFTLIQEGRFPEAVPHLEEAVRLQSGIGVFQNNLGMAYEHTNQVDRAKAAYAKAVQAGGSEAAGSNLERLGGTIDDARAGQPDDEATD
jgi:tetratricopeptide (TPR) repeat protein